MGSCGIVGAGKFIDMFEDYQHKSDRGWWRIFAVMGTLFNTSYLYTSLVDGIRLVELLIKIQVAVQTILSV